MYARKIFELKALARAMPYMETEKKKLNLTHSSVSV